MHLNDQDKSISPQKIHLTKTEIVIANLICQELSTKQIAAHLNRRPSTIDSHKKSLRKKTNALTVVGIAIYATKNKLCHLLAFIVSVLQPDICEIVSF